MAEDFNKLRLISHQLVETDFQKNWLFRLDIEGAPDDLDFYVKDVTYNPRELNTDDEAIGSLAYTWPTSRSPIKVNAVMRENEDGRIYDFIDAWYNKIIRPDGTVGLPYGADGYLKKVKVYWLKDNGSEKLAGEWEMYPTTLGEVNFSRENAAFMEFQVSFTQFATVN